MLEFLKSAKFKIFLIVICTVMAGSVIAVATVSSSSPVTSVVGFAFKPLQKLSGFISDKVDWFAMSFESAGAYKDEVERLNQKIAEYENRITAYDETAHQGLLRHIYVRRGVVSGVAAANGVANYGLTEVAVSISAAYALVDSLGKVAANDVEVLTDLKEYASHTGILTDRYVLAVRDLEVLDDVIKNSLCDLAVLTSTAILYSTLNVRGKVCISVNTKLLNNVSDLLYVNFAHFYASKYLNYDTYYLTSKYDKHKCYRVS